MSHLVETMFSVAHTPWHQLGTVLPAGTNLTSKEAMVQAGLDWKVCVQPLYTPAYNEAEPMDLPDGMGQITSGQFTGEETLPYTSVGGSMERVELAGVVRRETDGMMMGVVGPRWTPVQNEDAFGFFDPLVQKGLAKYHTAGSLKDGRLIWILAQVGNEALISGDDSVSNFLLLSMGHDGTRGIQISPTPIRVVCANTLSWAEAGAQGQKMMKVINHTQNAEQKLTNLSAFIEPYTVKFEALMDCFRELAATDLSVEKVQAYLKAVFPDPVREDGTPARTGHVEKVRAEVTELFDGKMLGHDLLPADKRSTAWTLYNSVTEYIDHNRGRTDDSRMESAWFGDGATLKKKALVAVRELVGV